MTAEEFNKWLDIMGYTGAEAGLRLGIAPDTITRYKNQGTGTKTYVDLACECLSFKARKEELTREAEQELNAELAARERREDRRYLAANFPLSMSEAWKVWGLEPLFHDGFYVARERGPFLAWYAERAYEYADAMLEAGRGKLDTALIADPVRGVTLKIEAGLPQWTDWKGEGPAPVKWRAVNPDTGVETTVYRSYADYCWD